MPRYAVLKKNTEFRSLYYRGRAFVHPLVIMYVRKSRFKDDAGRPLVRMGITAGKKIGKAVKRNRCRRLIRAAYAAVYPEISGGWDIVFVARPRLFSVKSTELVSAMRKLMNEAGLL